MKNILEAAVRFLRNVSIRWKIMGSVLFAAAVMVVTMLLIFHISNYALDIVGDSYKTNNYLDNLITLLSKTETAMESYMQYRCGRFRFYLIVVIIIEHLKV